MTFPDSLPIPDEVLEIARTLEAAGFETWCVGGALRDALLGHPHADYDLATAAQPDQVQSLFKRTAPVGQKYGTVGVIDRRRAVHEVTTFRRDVTTDGRHAVVSYGVSLDDDLARRDFTINAIAYHPLRREWRDPFGGEADLRRGVVRAVGEPTQRFREDYLRILRAIRFAARFNFSLDQQTWAAVVAGADGLTRLSAERVRDEWFKGLITAASISDLVRLWRESGAAAKLVPELAATPHETIAPVASVPIGRRDPVLLTAVLIADPAAVLRRLRASNAEIERAATIAAGPEAPSGGDDVAVRRWLSTVGKAWEDLLAVWALRHGVEPPWSVTVHRIRERADPLARGDLAISGSDLQSIGMQGPRVGEVLSLLLDQVLEEPSRNTRESLLAIARDLA
ncbi:MAG TPA: CCA tRNA nucleotidyltransferase [Gemmatimonadales bacterium]|jgi:tRNA nucleotidyltransferase (CCA-adding enzyme)